MAVEHLLGVALPERVKEAPLLLKALYDEDLAEEELIVAWWVDLLCYSFRARVCFPYSYGLQAGQRGRAGSWENSHERWHDRDGGSPACRLRLLCG